MDDDGIVTQTVSRVLDAAQDDWVQLVELQGYLLDVADESGIELWNPEHTASAGYGRNRNDPLFARRLALGMRVVEELLKSGKMVPGYIPHGFEPWAGSVDKWVARIEKGWRDLGTSLNLNDVCWFALREQGSRLTPS